MPRKKKIKKKTKISKTKKRKEKIVSKKSIGQGTYKSSSFRTNEEKIYWNDKKTTDEWKKNNLLEIKTRLKGWQLESFKESYKHKVKSGISLFKKQNLE